MRRRGEMYPKMRELFQIIKVMYTVMIIVLTLLSIIVAVIDSYANFGTIIYTEYLQFVKKYNFDIIIFVAKLTFVNIVICFFRLIYNIDGTKS